MSTLIARSVPYSTETDLAAVREIYETSFADDERVEFNEFLAWLQRPEPGKSGQLWAFLEADRIVAMGSAVYFSEMRMGYLPYLAVRDGLRGRGYGRELTEYLLEWIRSCARAEQGTDPRMILWDVRDPDQTDDPAERKIRQRRIEFYRRLGGQVLPIAYTYPPVAAGQAAVRDLLIVYTDPPGRHLTRAEALEVAWFTQITINHTKPEEHYYQEALASVEAHWPK